jgi:hypothetical protein
VGSKVGLVAVYMKIDYDIHWREVSFFVDIMFHCAKRKPPGKAVMTYFKDPNPPIGIKIQEHQEKIDCTQRIINRCKAHEDLQSYARKRRRNHILNIQPSKISISRDAEPAKITIFRDAYHVPIATKYKTFAYLERGEGHDYVFAGSGWSGGQFADIDGCIDRKLWPKRVFEFSRIIGHKLDNHDKDELGREGSHHACHAEKQLMAYVLWHHTSLQTESDEEVSEAEWMTHERVGKLHHCIWEGTDLIAACAQPCKKYHGPPVETFRPTIHITNDVCADCARFRERTLY